MKQYLTSMQLSWMILMILILNPVKCQRRVVGDIKEQSISQLADFDARQERVFRYKF